ncbi:MAG TPA: MFS transporter [Lachnospiraceae bacterium]|jgi:fucose permease|nr:MFS transporter [Lachnospiraceae bacterium]
MISAFWNLKLSVKLSHKIAFAVFFLMLKFAVYMATITTIKRDILSGIVYIILFTGDISSMSTLLLIVIYITFIGLGIPDSLFGTAWPAIYSAFGVAISHANFVTSIISGGTILSSLLSTRLIKCFGTAKVTAVSTAMTAGALLGFSIAPNIIFLCLFAVPLGIGAGAIDTALNNYVALHYRAVHMNFLHCFYGIGVSLSPYLMSLMLSATGNWRQGYQTVFWVQLGIAIMTIISIPLWKKVNSTDSYEEENALVIGIIDLLKDLKVRRVCLVFLGSCAIEYTCGVWGSTFLVTEKQMAVDAAAKVIMFYYIGMALGRFSSGILALKCTSQQMIKIGQCITLIAIALLLLPLSPIATSGALFLIGLGNGPIFPNMIHLTPENFGKERSQAVVSIQMSASYISILLAPVLFGLLAQFISLALFPYYLCAMLFIMLLGTFLTRKSIK